MPVFTSRATLTAGLRGRAGILMLEAQPAEGHLKYSKALQMKGISQNTSHTLQGVLGGIMCVLQRNIHLLAYFSRFTS